MVRIFTLVIVAILVFTTQWCTAQTWRDFHAKSIGMYQLGRFDSMEYFINKALEIHPSQPTRLYNKSIAEAALGQSEAAKKSLDFLMSWNAAIQPENDEDLKKYLSEDIVTGLKKTKAQWTEKVDSGFKHLALGKVHAEDISEGIHGTAVTEVHEGLLMYFSDGASYSTRLPGAGMAVEFYKDDLFFVTTAYIPEYVSYSADKVVPAYLLLVDAKQGKIIDQYPIGNAVIGAMCTNKDHFLFLSNSASPEVLIFDPVNKSWKDTIIIGDAFSLQGITCDPKTNTLYVADYIKGILSMDFGGRQQSWLKSPDYLLKGIDGLEFFDGDLIAIQNNSSPKRAIRLTLSEKKITNTQLLENALPYSGEPTNGYIDQFDKTFYYIANSPWPHYKDGKPVENDWEDVEVRGVKL